MEHMTYSVDHLLEMTVRDLAERGVRATAGEVRAAAAAIATMTRQEGAFDNFGQFVDMPGDVRYTMADVLCDAVADEACFRSLAQAIDRRQGSRSCRVCGCTGRVGCEEGCHWVADDLCSRCAGGE